MPEFAIIASAYHAQGVCMDVFRANANGELTTITARDAEAARAIAIAWLRENLGGSNFTLRHIDIIPAEEMGIEPRS